MGICDESHVTCWANCCLGQVTDRSNETWEFVIPQMLQDAATPARFMAVVLKIDDMIKDGSKIRDQDWKASKGPLGCARWSNLCKEVCSWKTAGELFKVWEDHAIDWREVPPKTLTPDASTLKPSTGARCLAPYP